MVDIVNGEAHDLTSLTVRRSWMARIASHEFAICGLAPVCTSFSRLLQPPVRDGRTSELLDEARLPRRVGGNSGSEYARRHGALTTAALDLLEACISSGTDFWLEHPLDSGARTFTGSSRTNRHYNRRASNTPSLFRLDRFRRMTATTPSEHYVHFIQCPFGAASPKPTTILASPRAAASLVALEAAVCTCTSHTLLRGTDTEGVPHSRRAQAYPGALCYRLAIAMEACAPAGTPPIGARARHTPDAEDGPPPSDLSSGESATDTGDEVDGSEEDSNPPSKPTTTAPGELQFGTQLHPIVRAALEAARRAPGRYASHRRATPASDSDAAAAAYPTIPEVASTARAPRTDGQPHPDVVHPPDLGFGGARPPGPTAIAQLFLPGIYPAITEWLSAAVRAMDDLAAGRAVSAPPRRSWLHRQTCNRGRGA
jgi:hypothetical protein